MALLQFSFSALNLIIWWQLTFLVHGYLPCQMSSFGVLGRGHRIYPLYSSRMPSEESYWEKYSGGSKEEMELKRMADEQYEEDDYYGGKMERYEDDDYDDDIEYEYEDEAYEKESPDPGNFWSNPSGRMDRPIPMSNRRPVRRSPNSNSEEMRRRPPKKR